MYQVKCDEYPLLDLRDENLILVNPKVKVETNTVGEGSFTIYKNHPYYGKLKTKKSMFEVSDEIGVLFRGRMTEHTRDFYNGKAVDLEGAMAFFNDSIVPAYNFPEDFLEDADYIAEAESGNVVKFFLKWFLDNHNSQVQDWQKFILGNVTVSDPNNYITRSNSNLPNTWEELKSKLFESALGGYLCIRYETDGNYIDYLSEFTLTNTQDIDFEKNLLDLKHESDASTTYSAIIPIGAEIDVVEETETASEEGETETETTSTTKKVKLTLESIADGYITDDIVKITLPNGLHALYSVSAVEEFGWVCAPVSETTWEDVSEANNLLSKGTEWLITQGIMLLDTVEITAADLHFTDEEIRSFRIYRKINVNSLPHDIVDSFDLTKLDIDLLNPQNTKITVGRTKLTLTDQNNKEHSDNIQKIEEVIKDVEANRTETTEVKQQMVIQSTTLINTCEELILSAMETFIETGDFSEFKQSVEASLKLMADEMELKFTETTTQIENVNGDLQETNTTLSKYFEFTIDGLVIKSGESAITLSIDNDMIIFKKNGVAFGWWDGENFHTGNIVVEVNERAQFGNFAFVPRSDGSLSFLKVDNKGGKSIVILTQPKNIQVTAGETGTFTITASGNELTYLWQYSMDEGSTWFDAVTTDTYSITPTEDATSYTLYVQCIVTDSDGDSVTSNVAKLYVSEKQDEETGDDTVENAEVTGITATYSGGDVAVGTALSDLTGITVKATYSDGSTSNVTGYTLSGEIAEGSNTITVSYEGLTTTFTVKGVIITYSITNNLTNATTSNNATSIEEGSSYSATITPDDGYALESVKVTMGGVDITDSVVTLEE